MQHAPNIAVRATIGRELSAVWNAASLETAEAELKHLIGRQRQTVPKLAAWLESAVPEGLSVFKLPEDHRRRMRTSNPIERSIQQELKRRTRKIRVFPNEASFERPATAVLVEIDEKWTASTQPYLTWKNADA